MWIIALFGWLVAESLFWIGGGRFLHLCRGWIVTLGCGIGLWWVGRGAGGSTNRDGMALLLAGPVSVYKGGKNVEHQHQRTCFYWGWMGLVDMSRVVRSCKSPTANQHAAIQGWRSFSSFWDDGWIFCFPTVVDNTLICLQTGLWTGNYCWSSDASLLSLNWDFQ